MQDDKLKNYLHLHFIVFIWSFTAILGKLISLQALDLIWFRMIFASIMMGLILIIRKENLNIKNKTKTKLLLTGIIIALHWFTFYQAIKIANISIALICLSASAFFASILEPILHKRKIIWYEILFGLIVIMGIAIIFKVESQYQSGLIIGLISAFLSALFSVINGKYVKKNSPYIISFYEIIGGLIFISIILLFTGKFTASFFEISLSDLGWLLILSSVCTAYAFAASIKVMKVLTPYTVMLTVNLEPVYGIILAVLIFKNSENMSPMFYVGSAIIIITVILNGLLKNRK